MVFGNINYSILLKRMLAGAAAAGSEQVINVLFQLVSVPLFLSNWGVELYGEWILLFTFPAYLSASDLGFAKATINSMTLSYAQNDFDNARRCFNSCYILLVLSGMLIFFLVVISLNAFSFFIGFLNISILNYHQVSSIIILLAIYVSLYQQAELLRGVLSASGNFPLAMALVAFYRLTEFLGIASIVYIGLGPLEVALWLVILQFLMIINLYILIKVKFSWLRIGFRPLISKASFRIIKELAQPAFAFLLLPIGYVFRLQVPIFLISIMFGPATIVIYSTSRTITNIGTQIVGIIHKVITPEYALAYGSGNMTLVKSIHHNSCKIVILLSSAIAAFLLLFGNKILDFWTGYTIGYDEFLFSTFLLSMMVTSLWSTSSFLAFSINRHTKQSFLFLMFSVLSCILTYLLVTIFGFSTAAIGLVICDLLMLYYVFAGNRVILNESTMTFIQNVFRISYFKMTREVNNQV